MTRPPTRFRTVALVLILGVMGVAYLDWHVIFNESSSAKSTFRGRSASAWAEELRQWDDLVTGDSNKSGRWTVWGRRPSMWEDLSADIGLKPTPLVRNLPLLEGDPASFSILVELMRNPEAKVRRIAAQGLKNIGPSAMPAVPTLLEARVDKDPDVCADAAEALRVIDPETARRVGLSREDMR